MSEATKPDHELAPAGEVASSEVMHVDKYEAFWLRLSLAVMAVFIIAILVASSAYGIQIPGAYQRINPNTLLTPEVSRFAEPGLRELAPGKYEAYIRAQTWTFIPNEIRIPAGSTLTLYITSQDVQHGMKIFDTNVNIMILPGQISKVTTQFDKPGTYTFVCHEYCGIGHHNMYGAIIVE